MTENQIYVEPIDDEHPAWEKVLSAIFKAGKPDAVLLHKEGWLSSRQAVLAAFNGTDVVGHLCFRIAPSRCAAGRTTLQSQLDSFSVDVEYSHHSVEERLFDLAEARAKLMRCPAPRFAS